MRESTDTECFLLKSKSWEALAELRGRMLAELQEKAQRLEATLVLTEDQRDKALKERDDAQRLTSSLQNLLENSRQEIQAYDVAYYAVVAERDEARAERATWKRECSDLAIKMKDLESEHRCDQIVSNVYRAQASQFAAQLREAKNSQDILLNGIAEAVAQRDAAIAERDAVVARVGVLRAELHYERQQHASTREMLRAKERGNT